MAPDTISRSESDASTTLRSMLRVSPAMKRLVTTAKRPEIEIACPACPSVIPRSVAIGVRRLTGMNSDAISTATQSAIEPTAPQAAPGRSSVMSIVPCIPVPRSLTAGVRPSSQCDIAVAGSLDYPWQFACIYRPAP